MQETLDESKKESAFLERGSFFFEKKTEDFSENTNEIKQTEGLFVRKKCLE